MEHISFKEKVVHRQHLYAEVQDIEDRIQDRISRVNQKKIAEFLEQRQEDAQSVASSIESLDESAEKEYHELDLLKCNIVSVSVFQNNAALVTRRGTVQVKESIKEQIVTFKGFSSFVNGDSVRIASTADCVIADIAFITKQEKQNHDQTNRIRIQSNIDELDDKRKALVSAKDRLLKQKSFLGDYQRAVVTVSNKDDDVQKLMDFENIEAMAHFMGFATTETKTIEEDALELDELITEIDREKRKQLKLLAEEKPETTTDTIRNVVVTVSTHQDGDLSLDISYIVSQASWTPLYDVRVNCAEKKLELVYYGIITQNTGEDWTNTNISLSTAEPNDSAAPPQLTRMSLNLVSNYARNYSRSSQMARKEVAYDYDRFDDAEECEQVFAEKQSESKNMRSRSKKKKASIAVQETTAEQGAISTVFHIPRYATIPSDNSPHKLNITLLTFDVALSYYAVPKLDTNSYLKVETINNSSYPLIPGEMSVFVDNNFVSTGVMPSCNPNEVFSTFLGDDPSIRILYAPPKRFKEPIGLLKNSCKLSLERKTTIKNTKQTAVTMIVTDQVPFSDDEKIKVHISKPKLSHDAAKVKLSDSVTANASINKEKNIEWEFNLPANGEVVLDLHYNVTWPISTYLDPESL